MTPNDDAARWNARYEEEKRSRFELPRPFLIENAGLLPTHGLALEAAMGLGGSAGFLLESGLRVIGVDISIVAVRSAKQRYPRLMACTADLNSFHFPSHFFDVILNFYYLQRDLWPYYKQALRPNGLLFFETLTLDMLETMPDIDPVYLLAPGELRQAFANWEILVYREGWYSGDEGHPRATAAMVARKPGQ